MLVTAIIQYFPVLLAIVGTIALALGGLSKYKEKRIADMLEATTTWKGLAESRQASIDDLRVRLGDAHDESTEYRRQVAWLWAELNKLQPAASPPPPFQIPGGHE